MRWWVLTGVSVVASGCSPCSEEKIQESISSRGDRVTVVARDCGATTAVSTVVVSEGLRRRDLVAFRRDPEIRANWSGDGKVLNVEALTPVAADDVFPILDGWGDIRVVVRQSR